jgi:heat shock protein HslJ
MRRFAAVGFMSLVIVAALAACSSTRVDGTDLDGTRWRAVSIAGRPVSGEKAPTITFSGGLASGSAGCNGYSTQNPMTINGDELKLGDTLSTLGRCVQANGQDAPEMAVEDAFLGLLRAADRIAVVDGRLVIGSAAGDIEFERT